MLGVYIILSNIFSGNYYFFKNILNFVFKYYKNFLVLYRINRKSTS